MMQSYPMSWVAPFGAEKVMLQLESVINSEQVMLL